MTTPKIPKAWLNALADYVKPEPTLKVRPRPPFVKPASTLKTRSISGPEMPIDFAPGSETLETLVHSTDFYHVVIGLDPVGTFLSVTGLSVENPVFTYEELGRNRSPVQLPWEGARKGGEVTLGWGTIIRSRFWNWFQAQTPFFMERQPVFILHLSRRNMPLRVFVLWDAWPKNWSYSDLGNNEVTVEKVTLVYDRMFMLDTALLSLQTELSNAVAEAPDLTEPPVIVQTQSDPADTKALTFTPVPQAVFGYIPSKVAPAQRDDLPPEPMLDEEYVGEASKTDPYVPLDEEYLGLAGTWSTEALEEDYVGLAGLWKGVEGKKLYAPKGGGAAGGAGGAGGGAAGAGGAGGGGGGGGGGAGGGEGGDGKAVEEEDG